LVIRVNDEIVSDTVQTPAVSELVRVGTKISQHVPDNAPVLDLPEAHVSEEIIPFTTETVLDDTLLKGERHVAREGKPGLRLVIRVNDEIVSDTLQTPAVSELVRVGTKISQRVPDNAPVLDLPEASVSHLVEREGNVLKYYDIWQDSKGHIIEKVLISSLDLAEHSIKGQELLAVEENISPSQNKMSSDDMSSELGDHVESYVAKPTNTTLPKTGDQSNGLLSILSSLGLSLGLLGLKGKKED
ncbi:G5 domain-containing protein, partial [Streptococcus suis]